MDQRCINGPQTQRLPYPAAQVLGWLFKCESTQISRSFAMLKQVRWWQGPVLGWEHEYKPVSVLPFSDLMMASMRRSTVGGEHNVRIRKRKLPGRTGRRLPLLLHSELPSSSGGSIASAWTVKGIESRLLPLSPSAMIWRRRKGNHSPTCITILLSSATSLFGGSEMLEQSVVKSGALNNRYEILVSPWVDVSPSATPDQ